MVVLPLVNQLRTARVAVGVVAELLGDAAARIEDLEDERDRLEDRIATLENDRG